MLPLYTDISVRGAIVKALLQEGIDLLRAQDDGMDGIADETVLDRAKVLRRVLLSQDLDFSIIAEQRQASENPFYCVIYVAQGKMSVRACVYDVKIILGAATTSNEHDNRLYRLPLK